MRLKYIRIHLCYVLDFVTYWCYHPIRMKQTQYQVEIKTKLRQMENQTLFPAFEILSSMFIWIIPTCEKHEHKWIDTMYMNSYMYHTVQKEINFTLKSMPIQR